MTRPAAVPAALSRGPFTRAQALEVISADTLRGPSYQRMLRGVHQRAGDITHLDRILAARQILPGDAALAGLSALWAHGVELAETSAPVEVILPPRNKARDRAHLHIRRAQLPPSETVTLALGPTTTAARTAFDLARAANAFDAVPLLDALVRATGVTRAQVLAVSSAHPGTRWLSRVQPALDLVDPGAESVRESQLRLTCIAAGFPRPVTQHVVRTADGGFVARVDLAWPELRVALEYDGAHHDERDQVVRDRVRANAIRRAGWTLLVVDAAQFARRDETLALIRSVLLTAGSTA